MNHLTTVKSVPLMAAMTDIPPPMEPGHIEEGDLVAYHPSHTKNGAYRWGAFVPVEGDLCVAKSIHHLVGHEPYVIVEAMRGAGTHGNGVFGAMESDFRVVKKALDS